MIQIAITLYIARSYLCLYFYSFNFVNRFYIYSTISNNFSHTHDMFLLKHTVLIKNLFNFHLKPGELCFQRIG